VTHELDMYFYRQWMAVIIDTWSHICHIIIIVYCG